MSTPLQLDDAAGRYGGIDGAHHKTWVIDQMVRALLDVPMVNVSAKDVNGVPYEFEDQGSNEMYEAFVREHCEGEDGPQTYSWEVGIPP